MRRKQGQKPQEEKGPSRKRHAPEARPEATEARPEATRRKQGQKPQEEEGPSRKRRKQLGAGGCTAWALAKAGLLGKTKAEVSAVLNRFIDPVKEEWDAQRRRRRQPAVERLMVGKDDDYWMPAVIAKAMKANGCGIKKLKIRPCMFERGKKYLVDGYLNRRCTGPKGYIYSKEGCDDPEFAHQSHWRHCVLVDGDGHFHCAGIDRHTWSNKYLWLDRKSGRPDRRRGYMETFENVYEIDG